MTGRTTWWACDAAEHDRELIVELGEEHGAAGPYVLRVLKDLAQQQRQDGVVRTGYRSLARKTFTSPEKTREIVEQAAAMGALDDLEIDADGRRFTVYVSGWLSDQSRGREAVRKAQHRAGDNTGHGPEKVGQGDDGGDGVTECPPTRPDQTREEENISSSDEASRATPDALRLTQLLADLIAQRDPKAKPNPASNAWLRPMRLLLADRDGDADEVEQVLRWSQADSFWQTNILSPEKLRKQFTQMTIKMKAAPIKLAGEAQRSTKPGRPDPAELERLVTSLFPSAERGRAEQAIFAAWGMGNRDQDSILEWAVKTDPEMVEGLAA